MIKGQEGEKRYSVTGYNQMTGKNVQRYTNNASDAIAIMIEMMKNGIVNVKTKKMY